MRYVIPWLSVRVWWIKSLFSVFGNLYVVRLLLCLLLGVCGVGESYVLEKSSLW